VRHGFFGRRGGVSSGIYDSLNCGPGSRDDAAAVRENRARVARALSAAHLVSLYQVHGTDIVTVRNGWDMYERPRADGMVTDRPQIALGTLAADCGPVLFADAQAQVIGAAHAGWRGALAGVLECTVRAMEELGARRERIHAALGPTIARPSYEVGPEFRDQFLAQQEANDRHFSAARAAGKFLFDLPAFIIERLRTFGIAGAEWVGQDTCADADGFFSHRRTVGSGGGDYGRNISAVVLEP
jgi:YfiH family protein